ncbi:hypothetical protein BJ170DRAFT_692768 [Xylariales sp. AK1849]|nr:hypothetical protein BJ170DRAFT_692768 [Xylariales sp. AK1849]
MFRRRWSGLPKDPHFPSDLKELGYFVHESDEIRSIANPDHYFHYFLSRNPRYNERQRFAMNEAAEKVVHGRLEHLGLTKTLLPLGTTSTSEPHIPIFVSSGIKTKSRVVIIIGETYQDLGIIAHRVLGGQGGVDKGSMVSVIRTLLQQPSSREDPAPPGIILANSGQSLWCPTLGRPLTIVGAQGSPMPSAVHGGLYWDGENDRVEGNKNIKEHIRYIFEKVVPAFVDGNAKIDVLAVGDGADALEQYLDWSVTWDKFRGRVNALAIVGGYHSMDELQCEGFREFLRERARGYTTTPDPLGTPISGPDGNPSTASFTRLGCPMFSGGEPHFVETLLVACLPHLAAWFLEVTLAGSGYKNPVMAVIDYADPTNETLQRMEEPDWSKWTDAPLHAQPPTDFGEVDARADIAEEMKPEKNDEEIDLEDSEDEDIKEIEKGLQMMI